MPTITEVPVKGFAHCRNPRCAGNNQEEVEAVSQTASYTYVERGGDLPGEENSIVRLSFANEDDGPCPTCGLQREVTPDPRPSYQGEWGQQDFLLDIEVNKDGTRFDPSKTAQLQAEASEKLQAENGELRERLARLEGYIMGQQEPPEPKDD